LLIIVCLWQVGHTNADREATIDPGCMTEEVLYLTLHVLAMSIEVRSQACSQGAVDIPNLLAGSCEHHDGVAVAGIVQLAAQDEPIINQILSYNYLAYIVSSTNGTGLPGYDSAHRGNSRYKILIYPRPPPLLARTSLC
jgi:hypothetical protein